MNILFVAMPGTFAAVVLRALLDAKRRIVAILVPAAPARARPVEQLNNSMVMRNSVEIEGAPQPSNVLQLATDYRIPVYALRRPLAAEAVVLVQGHAPDAVVVACFPWLIPPGLLAVPRHGFWNVHPSLLPAHRGPEPLFWSLRSGDFGVSIHKMDERFDSGPLAAQAAFAIDDKVNWERLQCQAAQLGGTLLNETLEHLVSSTLTLRPQSGVASYEPLPSEDDFVLDPNWSAQHAFRFMRGIASETHYVKLVGSDVPLGEAISYDLDAVFPESSGVQQDRMMVRCNPGVLYCALNAYRRSQDSASRIQ
jgi:methionyl-tRNA formyltransferase